MGHDDANHGNHLCQVSQKGIDDTYKGLVKDAKFICTGCGRTSSDGIHLCAPAPL